MKIKWAEAAINVFFWIGTGWMISTVFSVESQEIEVLNGIETVRIKQSGVLLSQLLLCILLALLMFYANLQLLRRLIISTKKANIWLGSLMLFCCTALLYFLLLHAGLIEARPQLQPSLTISILLFYYAVSVGYGLSKVWMVSESNRQALELEKKAAELNLLRTQLQPHFLFNVLNNLLALVDQQAHPRLAANIDQLSGLLRYVVYETAKGKVALQKEIDFIRNYIDLQMLRFEKDEIDLQLNIKGAVTDQQVEPGIFLPFIENAFKHGVEPEGSSFIHIDFDLSDKARILFMVKNSRHDRPGSGHSGGTGLEAAKKRLQIVYPGAHQLSVSGQQYYLIRLTLLLHESDHR